jgi:hypothetical protein
MKKRILGITLLTILGTVGGIANPLLAQPPMNSCLVANPNSFKQTLSEMTTALTAIRRGDPQPYTAKWSNANDVTLFGAWGPLSKDTNN